MDERRFALGKELKQYKNPGKRFSIEEEIKKINIEYTDHMMQCPLRFYDEKIEWLEYQIEMECHYDPKLKK